MKVKTNVKAGVEKKKGFGLENLMKPAEQVKTAEVTASSGSRG